MSPHVLHPLLEGRHMLLVLALFLLHHVWLVATPWLCRAKRRRLWLAEGLALGLLCGIFGFFIALLCLPEGPLPGNPTPTPAATP